jgi:non-ribosomal peptide synthetase component F
LKNGSPTAAGQTNSAPSYSDALIDTINQVFALFSINYHNQYYAAFADESLQIQAKRLWLEALCHYDTDIILRATKKVVETSDYLPTLHRFLNQCNELSFALPSSRASFEEACLATEPRENYRWSHPISYHAGKASGWFFIRSQPEYKTFPVFEKHYQALAERVRAGENLNAPQPIAIEHKKSEPLDKEEQIRRMQALRNTLALD